VQSLRCALDVYPALYNLMGSYVMVRSPGTLQWAPGSDPGLTAPAFTRNGRLGGRAEVWRVYLSRTMTQQDAISLLAGSQTAHRP
jgi:hypothetical protein